MSAALSIGTLQTAYAEQRLTPADVVARIFDRIDEEGTAPIWISLADRARVLQQAARVDLSLPLAGIPFAVKDNIDVAGMATTAGCPAFAYQPTASATVVQRLVDAGALLIGKTNMDQFATGLVGMRSPYGECPNACDPRYIAGGSSSGSALAVAAGLCAFALGTDTAGSGRVPAAFNDIVGLKPTRGLLSTAGVVPACRSIDCVSIFAANAAGADTVWRSTAVLDPRDPYARPWVRNEQRAWAGGESFRFGTPPVSALEFFGDEESAALYRRAIARLEAMGGVCVEVDAQPFLEAATLLYEGPWVAERMAAVGEFVASHPVDVHPIVRDIILSGATYSAVDAFRATYRLADLQSAAARQWERMDVLLLPTTGTIYTREAVRQDPVRLNANLGRYTNFVNLMDLAAVALPAGRRSNGLPFGISLVGPGFSDDVLLALARRYLDEAPVPWVQETGWVQVAVVGAHLTGEPLNHQLTERGARLRERTRTAGEYRLFALAGTEPAKPGLVREAPAVGAGIEVEVWSMPEKNFGSFVAAVPPPLCIGNVQLASGEWTKGFLCEPAALNGALDITGFGGWRSYRTTAHACQPTAQP